MSRGLGRGLDALLPASVKVRDQDNDLNLVEILVTDLQTGLYQPRKLILDDELEELTESIKKQGIIQPLVVRKLTDGSYEIVAGERRWRAATKAGLKKVPCIVRQLDNQTAGAFALIENMQREDLSAIEEAEALERLTKEFNLTHQQVADALGKSRTTISNLLRLNQLSTHVKNLLNEKKIEMGHARTLISLDEKAQEELADYIFNNTLTVRDAEKLVKNIADAEKNRKTEQSSPILKQNINKMPINPQFNEQIKNWQLKVKEQLSVNTSIKIDSKGKGRLVINFEDQSKLIKIMDLLK